MLALPGLAGVSKTLGAAAAVGRRAHIVDVISSLEVVQR